MITGEQTKIQNISAKLSETEIELAKAYIKGAVHGFCNNNPELDFSARILFGGDNRDWHNTPLQDIYEYHKNANHPNSASQAGIDVGWLLKEVLEEDVRTFEVNGKDTGRKYRLVR